MTAAGRVARGGRSIGGVLDALRPDFPDVTISKIRFLEAEGLINPGRTAAGYRQFTSADLERLRYVLTVQREHYLPLRVIKEQLDAVDRGTSPRLPRPLTVAPNGGDGGDGGGATRSAAGRAVRLTREDLLSRTGADDELITELVAHGLLRAGAAGFFDSDSVAVLDAARILAGHGLAPRHLRAFRTSAERAAEVLAQVAGPVARRGDAEADGRADELVMELSALSVTLHANLVRAALRRELDRA
ncbi:MAG: MerR family transcriptional regulator [Mycobacteriaceae bacterium]